MRGLPALLRFLSPDPRDPGCDGAIAALHVYAEAVLRDPARARALHPGVAVHLDVCGPCAEDLAGLLAALRPGGAVHTSVM